MSTTTSRYSTDTHDAPDSIRSCFSSSTCEPITTHNNQVRAEQQMMRNRGQAPPGAPQGGPPGHGGTPSGPGGPPQSWQHQQGGPGPGWGGQNSPGPMREGGSGGPGPGWGQGWTGDGRGGMGPRGHGMGGGGGQDYGNGGGGDYGGGGEYASPNMGRRSMDNGGGSQGGGFGRFDSPGRGGPPGGWVGEGQRGGSRFDQGGPSPGRPSLLGAPPDHGGPPTRPPPAIQQPTPRAPDTAQLEGQISSMKTSVKALQEQIIQSESNLTAQWTVLQQQQRSNIQESVHKAREAQLQEQSKSCGVKLQELEQLLGPIVESCTKDSISSGKAWIFQHGTNFNSNQVLSLLLQLTHPHTCYSPGDWRLPGPESHPGVDALQPEAASDLPGQ